jgi:uncharacterized protein with HEPN domain
MCCVSREWRFYLDDMIVFTEKALAYTQGHDLARFVASGLTYDATLRNLELPGLLEDLARLKADVDAGRLA